ncbi:MAG: hypothetical protein DWQ02_15510 [Bacteroidetes bacterium]|nr:MAG: hypothetical protein DWQ02_15510 [Bacteroidota bacterium]
MHYTEPLYFEDRRPWRQWLEDNFNTAEEAWLVYPKKATGKKRIIYNDAVEEALCFGWIDSIIKKLDDKHTMQRFTPRKSKSTFSQPNKERLKWLSEQEMIHPSVLPKVQPIIDEVFVFPPDILDVLKEDETVWSNFSSFPEPYKRIRIAFIDSARKRPEEYLKRLQNFIAKTRGNKLIKGFGGIDKYYQKR